MLLKLKRTPGIYLVGFMGSGKSTLGRLLAHSIGWTFCDLDADIEKAHGSSIADIFERHGEAGFRRLEAEAIRACVRQVERGQPAVLALGGGAFVQPDNYALLEHNGVSIWLDCPFDIIASRVRLNGQRPLARDLDSLRVLYNERRKAYELADFRLEIRAANPEDNLAALLELPLFK